MPSINTKPSCQTVSGGFIEPCNPDPADIHITDIAHSLSLANRWAGNTQYIADAPELGMQAGDPFFYSVAQHSCHVHDIIVRLHDSVPAFYALMHDASEAYLMDVPRPIKPELANYYEIEARLMAVILDNFGVTLNDEIKKQVVEIDNAMIFWERDAIVGTPVAPYGNEFQHPGGTIFNEVPNFRSWSPKRAKAEFLMRFQYHTQWVVELDNDAAFEKHLFNVTNDNLGYTSKWAGLAHLDFPKVA
jgi:5'-deoxynucleotidase YfbR-like HD superfamily hydrolase